MDEQTKRRIRERARILHWVSELLLAILLVLAVLVDRGWHVMNSGDIFLDQQLSHISVQVFSEFSRYSSGRDELLIAYPPPEIPEDREAWAQKIIADFDQPAAVFIRDRRGLSWITRPPEMAMGIEPLERVLARGVEKPDVVTRHPVGNMVSLHIGTLTDTTLTSVIMVGPENDSLRWGVVVKYWDTLRAFLKKLNDPKTMVGPRHPAYALQLIVLLPSDLTQDVPRMRAWLNGELLFQSPKLDTTRHRFVHEGLGSREEFYATRALETRALVLGQTFRSWKFFTAVALIMLIIHVYWLWIKKLTAPSV